MCRPALNLVLAVVFLLGIPSTISFADNLPNILQTGKYHEVNGEYTIKIRAEASVIDPGELLKIEIYLIGYGEIYKYKFHFSPSANISDIDKSKFIYIDALYHNGTNLIGKITSETFTQSGYHVEREIDFSNDAFIFGNLVKNDSTVIYSELKNGADENGLAPFEINIKTLDNIRPGAYSIHFIFTYFNGEKWKISEKKFEFVIRNFWQRHEQCVVWLGTVAATLTIIASIITIMSLISKCFKPKNNNS